MNEALVPMQTYSEEQVDLIKRTICQGATNDELALFLQAAKRLGLDPFSRQVFAVKRWNGRLNREVMDIQVSIDGFRVVAERSGDYAGQLGPEWCGDDGVWHDVWLDSKPPFAARVGVLRRSFQQPLWGTARFQAYKQTKKDGSVTGMWAKMPDLMLAKCAEALALRRAFPNDLGGVYSSDEMAQAEAPSEEPAVDVTPAKRTRKKDAFASLPQATPGERIKTPEEKHDYLLNTIKRDLLVVHQGFTQEAKAKRASLAAELFHGAPSWEEVEKLTEEMLIDGADKLHVLAQEKREADKQADDLPPGL